MSQKSKTCNHAFATSRKIRPPTAAITWTLVAWKAPQGLSLVRYTSMMATFLTTLKEIFYPLMTSNFSKWSEEVHSEKFTLPRKRLATRSTRSKPSRKILLSRQTRRTKWRLSAILCSKSLTLSWSSFITPFNRTSACISLQTFWMVESYSFICATRSGSRRIGLASMQLRLFSPSVISTRTVSYIVIWSLRMYF